MDISKTIVIEPGRYVIAVSGGVDSVVLLDILRKLQGVQLVVAHYDHGIRTDSHIDRKLVEQLARHYKLPFVYDEGQLGEQASEDQARIARYEFLRKVQEQANARGIITAHHMNDVIETATHNLLRGTGRRGMSSLKSVDGIMRPLTHIPKQHLIDYATTNKLRWREDSTNTDMGYRRNYIRHQILPRMQQLSPEKYEQYKMIIKRQAVLNHAIDTGLQTLLHIQPGISCLRRQDIIALPYSIASELVGMWLRTNNLRDFDRKQIELLVMSIKTAKPETIVTLNKNYHIKIGKRTVTIKNV